MADRETVAGGGSGRRRGVGDAGRPAGTPGLAALASIRVFGGMVWIRFECSGGSLKRFGGVIDVFNLIRFEFDAFDAILMR